MTGRAQLRTITAGAALLVGCFNSDDGTEITDTAASSVSTSAATANTSTPTSTDPTAASSTSAASEGTASESSGATTDATTGTASTTDASTAGTTAGTTDGITTTTDGGTTTDGVTSTTDSGTTTDGGTTGDPPCADIPPVPAGPEVEFAPEFVDLYKAYDLGPVPGIPAAARLGGTTVTIDDPDALLIAGYSEDPGGKIYKIGVERGACQHIVAFKGQATVVANTPYVDANLVYVKSGLLFYTEWPVNRISQLLPGMMAPSRTTDLGPLGIVSSPGGLGFVPPDLGDPGGMRALSWPGGEWYHITRTPDGDLYTLGGPVKTTALPNGPGGFAYVPQGSPGFDDPNVIVAEWSVDKVGVYVVNNQGDPQVATRKDFFQKFPRPWGAYFEPVTGDYLFLTWGIGTDRVYIVQGFKKPPPIPQ